MMNKEENLPEGDDNAQPDAPMKRPRLSGVLIYAVTAVLGLMLLQSGLRACGVWAWANGEKQKIEPKIEAMEMRLERESSRAINNLDPEYRRAVYERERGILAPGEELLPIYGDADS
jgi:hypothetical protein